MAILDRHAQYQAYLGQWQRCRDAVAGGDSIKSQGETYLPRLGGQNEDEYRAYKQRALFFNAMGRTVDGLSGLIFRKPPMLDMPDDMKSGWVDNVTLSGLSMISVAEQSTEEVLAVGRYGVLVDYPANDNRPQVKAQQADRGNKPVLIGYRAEQIINWRTEDKDGHSKLTQVRLLESVEVETSEFDNHIVEQVRVLDLDDEGYYRVRVFRDDSGWQAIAEYQPIMDGNRLDYIPFVFFGPRDSSPSVTKPPLIDLVDVNLSHYRTMADLEHGAHFTALPTPYVTGFQDVMANELKIGSGSAWIIDNPQATVGMLEFTGTGLEALEKRAESKEQQMAAQGARMLSPEKRDAEAAETMRIKTQGEQSALSSLAHAVSDSLTQCMEIARDWLGASGDVSIKLNSDFTPAQMEAKDIQALMQLWQAGGIAFRDLIYNLQRGEIIEQGRDSEDVQADVQTESTGMLMGGGDGLSE